MYPQYATLAAGAASALGSIYYMATRSGKRYRRSDVYSPYNLRRIRARNNYTPRRIASHAMRPQNFGHTTRRYVNRRFVRRSKFKGKKSHKFMAHGSGGGKITSGFTTKPKRSFSKKRSVYQILWNKIATPKKWRELSGIVKAAAGFGARTWWSLPLCGLTELLALANQKDHGQIVDTTRTAPASATSFADYNFKNGELCVQKYTRTYTMTNRSNAGMHVKIYYCVARKDMSATQYSIDDGGFDTVTTADGVATKNWDVGQAAVPTGLARENSYLQYTPYMSTNFCEKWRIYKTEAFELGANEYTSRKQSVRPKTFKLNYINDSGTPEHQRGFSKLMLITWIGQPVDSNSTATIDISTTGADMFMRIETAAEYHFWPACDPAYYIHQPASATAGVPVATVGQDGTSYFRNAKGAISWVVPVDDIVETSATPSVAYVTP